MGKIIVICLVAAGLFAASVEMPNTLAHEGHGNHDGHDHGPIEQPQNRNRTDSNAVITSPPPFETLNNGPSSRTPAQPGPEKVAPDREQRPFTERDYTYKDGPPSTLQQKEISPNGFPPTTPRQFDRANENPRRPRIQNNEGFRTQRDASPRFNRPLTDFNSEDCNNSSCPYQMSNESSRAYLSRQQAPYFMSNEYNCPYNSGHRIDTYMGLQPASDCYDEFSSCQYGGY